MNPLIATLVVGAVLVAGVAFTVLLESVFDARATARPLAVALEAPWRRAALVLAQQQVTTERPDAALRAVAPALYVAIAAAGLAIVPLDAGIVPVDAEAGIVLWGAAEALVVVAVFLNGWSENAHLPLVAGYRFVGPALSVLLLSMFVLIAAALPAESMRLDALVLAQSELWNVVRQPLGLPLFLVVALCLSCRAPLDFVTPPDLAGGVTNERSGAQRFVFGIARRAMLVAFAAMTATVLLGGYLGPWLPGPLWVAIKTLAVLVVLVTIERVLPTMTAPRFLAATWLVLLPISFLHLLVAGLEALP